MTRAPLNARQSLLWTLFDFSQGRGLEIGPLHSPAVPKEWGEVAYLDVFDRDQLLVNYAGDPGVPPDQVPESDYVLFHDGRVRSIAETVGEAAGFDWVMASHVVEHVPDLIGWLDDVAEVVADGGALVLAVPDRRYCFDLHRPGTSVGQLLQAHELGETVPSVRAVFDYKRGHASVSAPRLWAGEPVEYESRVYSLETVLADVERARRGEYVDSHVWLFTPGTFLEQLIELRDLGLAQWRVESLVPTPRDKLEFYAVLRRLPRDGWDDDLIADEPRPGSMPDWLAETTAVRHERDAAQRDVRALTAETERLRADAAREVRALEAERDALRADVKRLRRDGERARAEVDRLVARMRTMSPTLEYRVRRRVRRLPGFPLVRRVVVRVRDWVRP